MGEQDRLRFVKSLVDLEARLFNTSFSASGSLYFYRDLPATAQKLAVHSADVNQPDSLYIGPSTSLDLWYGRRSELNVERGPHVEAATVLSAGAKKEALYLERFGRPLFPMDRMRRETFSLEKQLPSVHLDSLQKHSQIAKHLVPQGDSNLSRPTIRHPDLRPSDIFASDNFEITSLIDWQQSIILPLFLQSGIPNDVDNSRDSVSRALETPALPCEIAELSEDEQSQQLQILAKRQLHHFHMTETADKNPQHFDALSYPFPIGRRKIFQLASAPWQGENIPLRSSLVFVKQNWQHICAPSDDTPCPITVGGDEEHNCLRLDELEQRAEEQLEASKEMLGLGPEGWVPHENYEAAQAAIATMKATCLEQAESEFEGTAVRDRWVFDDQDEDVYS